LPVTGRRERVEHAACERPTTVLGHVEQDAISTEVMSGGACGAHLQLASEEHGRGLAWWRNSCVRGGNRRRSRVDDPSACAGSVETGTKAGRRA